MSAAVEAAFEVLSGDVLIYGDDEPPMTTGIVVAIAASLLGFGMIVGSFCAGARHTRDVRDFSEWFQSAKAASASQALRSGDIVVITSPRKVRVSAAGKVESDV